MPQNRDINTYTYNLKMIKNWGDYNISILYIMKLYVNRLLLGTP